MTNVVTKGNIVSMKPDDLINWRSKHNLTQIELAEKLGVTKACVSRWESGKRKLPAFLHLALECLKVKRGGELKKGVKVMKKKKEVKR